MLTPLDRCEPCAAFERLCAWIAVAILVPTAVVVAVIYFASGAAKPLPAAPASASVNSSSDRAEAIAGHGDR